MPKPAEKRGIRGFRTSSLASTTDLTFAASLPLAFFFGSRRPFASSVHAFARWLVGSFARSVPDCCQPRPDGILRPFHNLYGNGQLGKRMATHDSGTDSEYGRGERAIRPSGRSAGWTDGYKMQISPSHAFSKSLSRPFTRGLFLATRTRA